MPFSDPIPVQYDQSQNTAGQPCRGYTLTAPYPAKGPPGSVTNPFIVALDPPGCTYSGELTITPFATLQLDNSAVAATFNSAFVKINQNYPSAQFVMTCNVADKLLVGCTHTESNTPTTGTPGPGHAGNPVAG